MGTALDFPVDGGCSCTMQYFPYFIAVAMVLVGKLPARIDHNFFNAISFAYGQNFPFAPRAYIALPDEIAFFAGAGSDEAEAARIQGGAERVTQFPYCSMAALCMQDVFGKRLYCLMGIGGDHGPADQAKAGGIIEVVSQIENLAGAQAFLLQPALEPGAFIADAVPASRSALQPRGFLRWRAPAWERRVGAGPQYPGRRPGCNGRFHGPLGRSRHRLP